MSAADDAAFHGKAAQWRRAFDQSFAAAPRVVELVLHDYLAIRAGVSGYALRLEEVAGLQTLKALTPCPSQRRELLGLGTFRGNVLPVYDLRVLLGHAATGVPAWWVVAKEAPLGLAFDAFERHLRLPPEAASRAGSADARLYAAETLHCEEQLRPIVSIDSILQNIRAMVMTPQISKENL